MSCIIIGVDYSKIQELSVTFEPGQMRVPLTITLLDDDIPEPPKGFRLVVSRELDSPNLNVGRESAVITISDTDGEITGRVLVPSYLHVHVKFDSVVEVGFTETTYTANEGDTAVLCVDLFGPETIDEGLLAVLTVSTSSDKASGIVSPMNEEH